MSDKRKRGRIGADKQRTLEAQVLRAYRHHKRSWLKAHLFGGDYGRNEHTAHMRLAQMFGIPCQQVFDIIDPDRHDQDNRKARHKYRVWLSNQRAELLRQYEGGEITGDEYMRLRYNLVTRT